MQNLKLQPRSCLPQRNSLSAVRTGILLGILFYSAIDFSSAQAVRSFRKLSCPEKWWVVSHLFSARKAWRIAVEARKESSEMEKDTQLDHDPDGGQVDAFRHAYWMARMAQEMCWRKAYKLGKAHEKGNYRYFLNDRNIENDETNDSVASAMDLYNNGIGLQIGCENKSMTQEQLKQKIREEILAGSLKVVYKDTSGSSLDCAGKVIDPEILKGRWNTSRCLVSSEKKK